MQVNYAYLDQQFAEVDDYFDDLRRLVATGEFAYNLRHDRPH